MADSIHIAATVAGALWGVFLGLLPFALAAMLFFAQFDPKRKGGDA